MPRNIYLVIRGAVPLLSLLPPDYKVWKRGYRIERAPSDSSLRGSHKLL